MPLSLEITKEIPTELIEAILQMDHDAYPPEDQMTRDRAYMIYTLIADSLILLREDGRLIGHLSVYAIKPELVQLAIQRQKYIFLVEEAHHLLPRIDGSAHGYIHNIILRPEYRGLGYRRYLLLGLSQWLECHPGITDFWGDAVSGPGQRALGAMGLTPRPELCGLFGGGIQSVREALDRQLAGISKKDIAFSK